MAKVNFSIIVLSYNTKDLLKLCLKSIYNSIQENSGLASGNELNADMSSSFRGNPALLVRGGRHKAEKRGILVETIVVDNASDDGSPDMVEKEFTWVKLVRSQFNLGYSGGNNLGIKESQGKYILFLNSDVEISKNTLVDMKIFLDTDRKIGAVTPKVMLYKGGMDPDCHRGFPSPWASFTYFLGLGSIFPKSKLFGQYHKFYQDLDTVHEIDAGFGTFMVIRAEVVKSVGVWDEGYFFY